MNEFIEKTKGLILQLESEDALKTKLIKQLEAEGVSQNLLEEIDVLINQAETNLLKKAKEQTEAFKKSFDELKKQLRTEEDKANLAQIRNKIKES